MSYAFPYFYQNKKAKICQSLIFMAKTEYTAEEIKKQLKLQTIYNIGNLQTHPAFFVATSGNEKTGSYGKGRNQGG